ncbi:MAG: hypothetical protein ACR2K4_00750 [Candidatus Limnocylindria bacterium]
MTLVENGAAITYRLHGVMRDTDPASAFATVTLEPLRSVSSGEGPGAELRDAS